MRRFTQRYLGAALALAAVSLLWSGCKPQKTEQTQRTKTTVRTGGKTVDAGPKVAERAGTSEQEQVPRPDRDGATGRRPLEKPVEPLAEDEDLPPPAIAKVDFSEQHAKSNLVGVGEPFPELKLIALEGGQSDSVAAHLGDQGTVVLFWKGDNLYALQELGDLFRDIVRRYGHQGINVVGVNVGDSADEATTHAQAADAKFPQLLDPDGAALARLATGFLPRTYLLDGQGKIVWFDIEYSPTTRRQLRDAVRKLVADQ